MVETQRRTLRFASFDEVLHDVDHLLAHGYRRLGSWSLGQVCAHQALFIGQSIDGFAMGLPFFVRWVTRPLFKTRWIEHGLPNGLKLKGKLTSMLPPDGLDDSVGVEQLRAAFSRLQNDTQRQLSPILGHLTREEWDQLHLRHAEHHLSFLVPEDNAE